MNAYKVYIYDNLNIWVHLDLKPDRINGIELILSPIGSDLPDRDIQVSLSYEISIIDTD